MIKQPETLSPHRLRCVLVTGGAGFIGSNFLLRMVPAHPDVTFINLDALTYAGNLMNLVDVEGAPNYRFVHGDIRNADLVRSLFQEYDISSVVHFAADSHVDRSIMAPVQFVESNVLGTVTLLEAAREAWQDDTSRRFLHVSTDEVFGSLGDDGLFEESTRYDPKSPYSASKAASDHLARAYEHTYGLPVIITNCSNNYGPFQFPEKLIPLVIANARDEKDIPVYGQGENVRDWLYVGDHCEAIELALTSGSVGRTYLIGGNAEVRNIDLVKRIVDLVDEALGRPEGTSRALIRFVADRPGHDYRYAIDFSRTKEELGWEPRHELSSGLRETVRWYLDSDDWLGRVMDASYRDYYTQQYQQR